MDRENCDIALIGLAVMGQNLVLNMNDHGYRVAVFNRTVSKVDDFINNEARGTQVVGTHSLEELASVLKKPRRVMLMVKAGDSVKRGDVIGYIGSTGRSTGSHLHYEILVNGQLMNPLQLLTSQAR